MAKLSDRILIGACLLAAGFFIGRMTIGAASKSSSVLNVSPASNIRPRPPEILFPAEARPAATVVKTVKEQIPTVIGRWNGKLGSEAQYDELLQGLVEWAKTNPLAALDFARQHLPLQCRSQAESAILTQWTKADPQAAWNWTTNNVPKDMQQIDAVLSQTGKTDSDAAWRFASDYAQTHPTDAASIYVSALRGMLYAGDYEKAAELAKESNLSESKGEYDLSSMVVSQWADYDPAKASEWAVTLPEGMVREQALVSLGQNWSLTDPKAATTFAVNLTDGKARQMMLTQALPNWANEDPSAVTDWLNHQPSSPDFDLALSQMTSNPKFMEHVPVAVAWANTISDQELRTQALTRIIATMNDGDAAAAMDYLNNSADIPPALRNEIRGRIENRDVYSINKATP